MDLKSAQKNIAQFWLKYESKIVLISDVSRSSVGPIAHNLPHFHPHDADGFPDLGIRCLGSVSF